MIFFRALRHSVRLPARNSVFRLNRIGMDITVVYMFFLLLMVSIPSLITRISNQGDSNITINLFFFLIYFFIFFYLPLVIFVFVALAVVAYIGMFISQSLYRKIRFAVLWKMCAYTTTIPFFIYTIIALFIPIGKQWLWLVLLYTLAFMIKIITIYPRRKRRPHGFH